MPASQTNPALPPPVGPTPAPAPVPKPPAPTATPNRFVHRHLPYLLARASHALWRGFEPKVKAAGLNSLEWRVLATLYDGPPLAVGQLAAEVLAKQPTLTKSLDRLQAQGLVERRAVAGDARRAQVALTTAGKRKAAPLIAAADAHQRARLQALGVGAEQEGPLRDALASLVRHFDSAA